MAELPNIPEVSLDHIRADIAQKEAKLTPRKKRVLMKVAPLLISASLFVAACQSSSPVRSIDISPTVTPDIHQTYKPVYTQTPIIPTPINVPRELEPVATIISNPESFENFLPFEKDSLNSTSFINFIGNPDRLIDAWTVNGSIYARWFKIETFESIKYAPRTFLPRWSEFELLSNQRLNTQEIVSRFGRDTTAIILDSGGQHSVAMAYELAKDGGWQPVPMLRGIPCTHCALSGADQALAVALYPASEMLGITANLPKTAPPAFIWDTHRKTLAMPGEIDNTYKFQLTDMPNAEFLKQQGITSIIYINESKNTIITPWEDLASDDDSEQILRSYRNAGLQVYQLGISPIS